MPQSKEIVESSSNLAIVRTEKDKIVIQVSIRSSLEE